MSALSDTLLSGATLDIEPMDLRVTLTHDTGNTSTTHLIHDGDLGVIEKSDAAPVLGEAQNGRVVIALGVDDESDHIFFQHGPLQDTVEVLRCAVEALAVALTAAERASAPAAR